MLANDDPVIGHYKIEDEIKDFNENIIFGITKYGGHLGYFESFSSS
jgi:predicted alpha/beta-fold hydrolase